jgi:hypothetical protein
LRGNHDLDALALNIFALARDASGNRTADRKPDATLGAINTLRFALPVANPNDYCQRFDSLQARTAYAGQETALLEDVSDPLAGRLDSDLQSLGRFVDTLVLGFLRSEMGDPLAFDAQAEGVRRVHVVFTHRVGNDWELAGLFSACDLDPQWPASNGLSVVYIASPADPAKPDSTLPSLAEWRERVRSSVVHEMSHLTAAAERHAHTADRLETAWIEEGIAEIMVEGYHARVCGFRPSTNIDSLALHVCANKPEGVSRTALYERFVNLGHYYQHVGDETPLGSTSEQDQSYYGSSWAFLRWIIDNYAYSDSAFLHGIVRDSTRRGARNIEARTSGRSFASLLGAFSLAAALDDLEQFTPSDKSLTFPRWNTPSVLATMYGGFPLAIVEMSSGGSDSASIHAGSARIVSFTVTTGHPRIIELRSIGGGTPDPALRLAIVRLF